MEACHNSYLSKNHIVARFSWGSSETQSLFSKQSLNKLLLPLGALVTSQTQLDVSNVPIVDEDKIGVLLLNLGGPETLDDVQPFLFNLFADPVTSFRFFFSVSNNSLLFTAGIFIVKFFIDHYVYFDSSIFTC